MKWFVRSSTRARALENAAASRRVDTLVQRDVVRARQTVARLSGRGAERTLSQVEQLIPEVLATMAEQGYPGAARIRVDFRFPRFGWLLCTWTDDEPDRREVRCHLHADGGISASDESGLVARWFDRRDPYWHDHAGELLQGLLRLEEDARGTEQDDRRYA